MAEPQDNTNDSGKEEEPEFIPFATFLADYPTGTWQKVTDCYNDRHRSSYDRLLKCTPPLRLYCSKCNGVRNFDGKWKHYHYFEKGKTAEDFLVYTCRDCDEYEKHYCLLSWLIDEEGGGEVIKIGEYPELNIKLPTSLPKLLGEDYPYFIKGLKCEKQGLGIAAYSYYRRVVENQKDRLFGEILKVAEKLGAKKQIIQTVQSAIDEVQFSKAVDIIKEALPESLLIDGHNPFKLLHKALSVGIHNQPDEKCLKLAHDIRIVLTDLSERLKMALSEKKGLRSAVSSLLKFNRAES